MKSPIISFNSKVYTLYDIAIIKIIEDIRNCSDTLTIQIKSNTNTHHIDVSAKYVITTNLQERIFQAEIIVKDIIKKVPNILIAEYKPNGKNIHIASAEVLKHQISKSTKKNKLSENKKALVIGISDYMKLKPLRFCKKDGDAMLTLLNSLGYDTYNNKQKNLIETINGHTLKDTIIDFFNEPTIMHTDTLLFYFSGHAIQDADDTYFAASDIDPDIPTRRGFSFNELRKAIEYSRSRRIIAILDCCYSGAAMLHKGDGDAAVQGHKTILDNLSKNPQGEGKCMLLSSQDYQKSYPLSKEGHSVYTYYLLEGLSGNDAALDKKGNVTPQTLGKYVFDQVTLIEPKQKPLIKSEVSGDIVLASYKYKINTKK